jgi:hypothetical protein
MKSIKSLPAFLKITLLLSIIGLLLSAVSFAFPKLPAGLLCVYFCGVWLLWHDCIFLRMKNKEVWLALLWVIIDVSILVTFLSVTSSVGDVRHSQGTEMVWGMAYLPVLLVWIAISYIFPNLLHSPEKAFHFAELWFGKAYGGVVADWLALSVVAASQLLFVLAVLWGIKMWRKKAPTRSLDTDRG